MTRAQYLLIYLMEEAAELQQEASKCLRFGLDDYFNGQPITRDRLLDELVDLVAVIKLLEAEGVLPKVFEVMPHIEPFIKRKQQKAEEWANYSMQRGILKEQKYKL